MAARVQEVRDKLEILLKDEKKPWTKPLQFIETKTGVDRLYVFIGFVCVLAIYLIFGYGAQLICNLIGFLYPAYTSIKAIESPQKDDDTKWLTYWVVYALFSVIEFFADIFVGWFPFYWLAKCFFMIWLMLPTDFNGSIIIYRRILRPHFIKHESAIDATISNIKDSASKIASTIKTD